MTDARYNVTGLTTVDEGSKEANVKMAAVDDTRQQGLIQDFRLVSNRSCSTFR